MQFFDHIQICAFCLPFCPLYTKTYPSAAAGSMLLVGIMMEMLSFETVSGSFHRVDCRGSKKGGFFLILQNNIHTYFHVWVSSFGAFECFILGNIFQSHSKQFDTMWQHRQSVVALIPLLFTYTLVFRIFFPFYISLGFKRKNNQPIRLLLKWKKRV